MKIGSALQTFLVAGALAQLTPSDHYNRICPSLDDQTEEINSGYTVRYKCGVFGNHNGRTITAYNPQDCARVCQDTSGCVGSSWLSDRNRCVLSGEQKSGIRLGTVYMKEVKVDPFPGDKVDPFPEDPEETVKQCRKDQQECTEQLGQCNDDRQKSQEDLVAQLSRCEAQKLEDQQQSLEQLLDCQTQQFQDQQQAIAQFGECKERDLKHQQECTSKLGECRAESLQAQQDSATQLSQCREQGLADKQQAATELGECKDQALKDREHVTAQLNQQLHAIYSTFGDAKSWSRCPELDRQTGTVKGKKFTVWCGRHHMDSTTTIDATKTPSFEACIERCAKNEKCHLVRFGAHHNECELVVNRLGGKWHPGRQPLIVNSGWHSAVLH